MPPKQKARPLKPANEKPAKARDSAPAKDRPSGRISAACKACKTRKTKCSGYPPPCQICLQLDTPCVIDLTLDMRRRTALRRILEESSALQETFNNVLGVLRQDNSAEIQDLVAQIQRADRGDDDLMAALQARFHGMHNLDRQSRDRPIKGESHESVHVESTGEAAVPSSSLFDPIERPQKRPLSAHDDDDGRATFSTSSHSMRGVQAVDTVDRQHLPLISQPETASGGEATRISNEFSTLPGSSEGVRSHDTSQRRILRPNLNTGTGRSSRSGSNDGPASPDRSKWHPSLQLTDPSFGTPLVQHSSPETLNEEWSPAGTRVTAHRNSFAEDGTFASELGARSLSQTSLAASDKTAMTRSWFEETSEDAPTEHQKHPAIYSAMQVHSASKVMELFGDLRLLGQDNPHGSGASLDDVLLQSSATIPKYLLQSRLVLENSPLSRVFTGFRDAARQMIATGTPPVDVVGGDDVIVDLYFRNRLPTDDFTCSSWASELCKSFGEIDEIVRIGCIFLYARLMRWMVYPTSRTFAELPDCQRPTPTQCFVPHMPAIDLHPMPAMRDILCHNLQDWLTSMKEIGVSCNWPLTLQEALVLDTATGSIKISPDFGVHVSQSENWSINAHAIVLFPELAGKVRVEER